MDTIAHKRKYRINEDFFDQWSPEMAYVLGFWFADGYMRHERSYRIVFCSTDNSLLLKIRSVMGSNHLIYGAMGKKSTIPWHQLTIFSWLCVPSTSVRTCLVAENSVNRC